MFGTGNSKCIYGMVWVATALLQAQHLKQHMHAQAWLGSCRWGNGGKGAGDTLSTLELIELLLAFGLVWEV